MAIVGTGCMNTVFTALLAGGHQRVGRTGEDVIPDCPFLSSSPRSSLMMGNCGSSRHSSGNSLSKQALVGGEPVPSRGAVLYGLSEPLPHKWLVWGVQSQHPQHPSRVTDGYHSQLAATEDSMLQLDRKRKQRPHRNPHLHPSQR